MASEQQIAANRWNARKSTGPRSAEGKTASSMNALVTGVHAQSAIIRGEDPAALDTLTAEYYATHPPITAEERLHVDSMIRFDWQLRRLTRIEAELYEYRAQESSRLNPNCSMGQIYSNNSATLSRITRQTALVQRCFRDASREFQSLRAAHIEIAKTNPIPASGMEGGAGASACQLASLQSVETNPIPVPEPVISTASVPDVPAETNPIPEPPTPKVSAPAASAPLIADVGSHQGTPLVVPAEPRHLDESRPFPVEWTFWPQRPEFGQ